MYPLYFIPVVVRMYLFINSLKYIKMSKLTFYFKSGNQVTIDKVQSWKFSIDSELNINGIEITQPKDGLFRCKKRMIVKTIDFKSIECVVEH